MSKNLRYAGIAALALLVIVPIVYYMMFGEDAEFAVAIMLEIAVIGFFTVIFVMIIGLVEDHYPTEAKDSAAVTAWSQRTGAMEEAKAQETVEKIEEVSGDGVEE